MADVSRQDAWQLVTEWVESDSLRKHLLGVEAAMRAYARKWGEDEEIYAVTGLVHDLDYERYPDLETGHPRYAIKELGERGVLVSRRDDLSRQGYAALDDELLHRALE